MIRFALVVLLATTSAAAAQESKKEEVCGNMAQVVRAIQEARLDRVKERDVEEIILAQAPTWPENYNRAIPLMTPWVYEQRMRDVRRNDLGEAWDEVCQNNWQSLAEQFE